MQRDASVINYRLRNFPPSNLDFDRMLIAFGIDRFRVFDDENRFISSPPPFFVFFFLSSLFRNQRKLDAVRIFCEILYKMFHATRSNQSLLDRGRWNKILWDEIPNFP